MNSLSLTRLPDTFLINKESIIVATDDEFRRENLLNKYRLYTFYAYKYLFNFHLIIVF